MCDVSPCSVEDSVIGDVGDLVAVRRLFRPHVAVRKVRISTTSGVSSSIKKGVNHAKRTQSKERHNSNGVSSFFILLYLLFYDSLPLVLC